ncbi:MAG: S-layer homology domain-containing protein [Chloroflexota bacterium]
MMKIPVKIVVAALLVGLAAILSLAGPRQAAASSPDDTITLTGPAPNTIIAETDDYATQVLGDPWDFTTSPPGDLRNYHGLNDISQPYGFTTPDVSGGIWSAVTAINGGSSVSLQYQSFPTAYSSLGEKNGQNYPVDSNRFNRLLVRMNAGSAFPATFYFYSNYNTAPTGNSNIFTVNPGWNIYSVDLRQGSGGGSGNWTQAGPYQGLMLQNINGGAGNPIQIDWARLTPDTGATVRITWTYSGTGTDQVHLYLSTSADPNADNELPLAIVSASTGAYSWNTTGVAPGDYYIHAEFNGAVSAIGPLTVNAAPITRIDAPSPLSGEDYAYVARNAGWDGANASQFQAVVQIANLVYNAAELRGNPTGDDPQLIYLNHDTAHPIDASRYRYYSNRFEIDPPASRTDAPYNAGPRLLWDDGSNNFKTSLFRLWPYRRYVQAFWDLPNVPVVGGGAGQWAGQITTFRFDPLEPDDSYSRPPLLPDSFGISDAHLTSMPIAGRAGDPGAGLYGTVIRWTAMQGGGTVSLYRDTNNAGFNGTLIAANLPLDQETYSWDTAAIGAGTYYVYAIADDGRNTSRFYSLVPILVDQGQPATLFTDVPNGYFAVDYINRLAMRNIIGGSSRSDTTVLFKPANTATRAQLSKIVVIAANFPLQNPGTGTFHDVAPGSTFYTYVETAAAHNVISGYPCGSPGEPCDTQNRRYFRPGNSVTRAQTAKMVSVSRGWPIITPADPTFADMPYDADPAGLYSFVETAAARNIIAGYPCGGPGEPCDNQNRRYYRPSSSVTRAQLSKMVSVALDSPADQLSK